MIANQKMKTKKWFGTQNKFYSKRKQKNKIKQWTEMILITVFCAIGCLAVLYWSGTIFWQAARFYAVDPKKIVYINSVVSKITRADSSVQAGELPESQTGEASGKNQSSVEELVKKHFGNDAPTALAIFKSESGLKPNNQNWNCYYNGQSQSCRPGDEVKAWSVDCGIGQINVKGTACPKELFDPETNIKVAHQMFQSRKFTPWVNFNNGRYLSYL